MQAIRVLPLRCEVWQREAPEWSGMRDSYNHAREGAYGVARCGCQGVGSRIRWFNGKEMWVWIPAFAGKTVCRRENHLIRNAIVPGGPGRLRSNGSGWIGGVFLQGGDNLTSSDATISSSAPRPREEALALPLRRMGLLLQKLRFCNSPVASSTTS